MSENINPQAAADFDRAMDKIRDEMAKSGARYVAVVGEYMTDYLRRHRESAGKILAQGKTIAGSLGAMREEARKGQSGGVGILDDETAFGVVLRYYGIEDAGREPAREPAAAPEPDDLSLDALMGVL